MKVNVSPQLETVWLSSNQMALLYGRDEKTIRKHVNKIFADGNKLIDDHTLGKVTGMSICYCNTLTFYAWYTKCQNI